MNFQSEDMWNVLGPTGKMTMAPTRCVTEWGASDGDVPFFCRGLLRIWSIAIFPLVGRR